jgi:Tfp pilus assembly protein PilF
VSIPDKAARWIVPLLVAAVCATYAGVLGFDFVRYDDPDYVLENPLVRAGLSGSALRAAFTSTHASNWHPLTWLSHQLDVELFGLAPAAHHASSVLWHALAAALCYRALRALTGRTWPSALAAALFALHPLRVESVAWISERKDVLSGALFFGTLLAYARYARAPSAPRYLVLLASLAAGLLAKPMLVTTPFLLLLLDLWPLRRIQRGAHVRTFCACAREKLPLFLLSALGCALTVHAQRTGGALQTLATLPLEARAANAPLAVVRYLAHVFWPAELSYFYPHAYFVERAASGWNAAAFGALALLTGLTLAAVVAFRRAPEVLVGWLWFLGLLVPVIGLVQVGEQALADRYTYLPSVGLAVALVFPLAELVAQRPRSLGLVCGTAGLALIALAGTSALQARVWRNSRVLFEHALTLDERNYAAWSALANERAARNDIAGARAAYERALAILPSYAPALYSLGLLEQEHGDAERALALYRSAAASLPGFLAAELNLGSLLARRGESVAAAEAFERVLALDPLNPEAHFNLGLLLLQGDALAEAETHLRATLAARADFPLAGPALEALAAALAEKGEFTRAAELQEEALEHCDPTRQAAARERAAQYRRGEGTVQPR